MLLHAGPVTRIVMCREKESLCSIYITSLHTYNYINSAYESYRICSVSRTAIHYYAVSYTCTSIVFSSGVQRVKLEQVAGHVLKVMDRDQPLLLQLLCNEYGNLLMKDVLMRPSVCLPSAMWHGNVFTCNVEFTKHIIMLACIINHRLYNMYTLPGIGNCCCFL